MTQFVIAVEGLSDLSQFVDEIPPAIKRAALRAVGTATDRARTASARAVREQVRFPASYLYPSQGRLTVAKRPTLQDLTGTVRGRQEATSLARFARGKGSRGGVMVSVAPGRTHRIPRSFLMRLKSGNRGLAVRTDGEAPVNAYKPKKIGKNLWLLYGPSVDQVLFSTRNQAGVFTEVSPQIAEFLEKEFVRLLNVEID